MGILRTDKISGLETPTAVTGSVSFDGTDDALIIADYGDTFDFLNSDFTVECWIYPRGGASSSFGGIWSKGQPYQLWWKEDTERVEVYASSNGSTYDILNNQNSGTNSVPANQWSHIAHTREGDTFRIFVNGILLDSTTSSSTILANTNSARIADYDPSPGTYELDGEISNLRVLKGTALYTADFTPPTHALEVIKDTIILCCNNPDSVTAAAFAGIGTSYAITTAGNPTVATRDPGLTRDFTFGTQFEGVTRFDTQGYFVPPSGTTEQRGRGRGILYGGYRYNPNANQKIIESIQISSGGNAQKFGDIDVVRYGSVGVASPTRGVFFGGADPSTSDIDFITIATEGNPVEFGSATTNFRNSSGVSNGVRGIVGGKFTPSTVGTIDYVTIAALGDAQDFGDLSETRHSPAAASSNTRGVFAGGSPTTNTIDYVTIATVGATAQDFGDLTVARSAMSCSSISNGVRGVFGGGRDPAVSVVIDFVTIATLGNAQDFGDLSVARGTVSGLSDKVRGIFAGGYTTGPTTSVNTIEYVTIASTGNTQDFGDMSIRRALVASCSDSHGGIS